MTTGLCELVEQFEDNANPHKAQQMATYMRNQFVFLGIQKPIRVGLSKEWLDSCLSYDHQEIVAIVNALWNLAPREYQYVAIDLMIKAKLFEMKGSIELIERFILEKSWWDTVDILASNIAGKALKNDLIQLHSTGMAWAKSQSLWLNRSALLLQLTYKEQTDCSFLLELIEILKENSNFFVQKAIGWALRSYSYTDAVWVEHLVETLPLSTLARREALRHIHRT